MKSIFSKILFFCFAILSIQKGYSQSEIDSLKMLYRNSEHTDESIKYLVKIGNLYTRTDYDSAIHYANIIISKSPPERDKTVAYRLIGFSNYRKGNSQIALEYYLKAANYYENIKNDTLLAQVYNNIGQVYYTSLNKKMAALYWEKALESSKKINNDKFLSDILNNLGVICVDEKEYLKSIEYYKECEKLDLKKNDYESYAATLINIGSSYRYIYDETKNKKYKQLAVEYTRKALRVNDSLPLNLYTSVIYSASSEAFLSFGMLDEAVRALENAEKKSSNFMNKDYASLLRLKGKILMAQNKTQEAFSTILRYANLVDSLTNEENNAKLVEMEAKYQNEEKQKQIALQEVELQKKDLKIQQSKLIGYALSIGVILLILLLFMIYKRYHDKQKAAKLISTQKEKVEHQNKLLANKNNEITQSIRYAQKIQKAILPDEEAITKVFPDSFILFKPKDIVSGDFYWLSDRQDYIFYATVDCTGHGVPGGFMSMLGTALLNEIIDELKISDCAQALNIMREKIIQSLKQVGDSENKDGMDMVLIRIDKKTLKMQYAAANNSIYIVQNFETNLEPSTSNLQLEELPCDKMPVGFYHSQINPFQNFDYQLSKGNTIYTFTDGFADQFGGAKGKKYNYKSFREKLIEINHLNLAEQKNILNTEFENWKGEHDQLDDVCIMGVKI